MKAIIDIGSNSVRLAVFEDGQIVFKGKITSQLGRGMALSGRIDDEHREKTVAAVATLVEKALSYGVQKKDVFLFATAAARRAANAKAFLDEVLAVTGLAVDVVSEKDEAELALSGALGEADGAVLDIGGASAELIVRSGGATVYKQSLPLGAVVLSDAFGKDSEAMKRFVDEQVKKYGDPPAIDRLIGVGGTASCLARVVALSQGRAYSGGDEVKLGDLDELCLKFFTLGDDEIASLGVETPRTGIIGAGTLLLISVLRYLKLDGYVASEGDNLEGYYHLKVCGKRENTCAS